MALKATEISLSTRVKRKEIFVSEIGDELILFDEDAGRYFATGPVGARIWEWIATERSIGEICDALQKEFEVSAETCETECMAFVARLKDQGLASIA